MPRPIHTPSAERQIQRTNAASFAKLLEEAKRIDPTVQDIVWNEESGNWLLIYVNNQIDEFLDFGDIILCLNWVRL